MSEQLGVTVSICDIGVAAESRILEPFHLVQQTRTHHRIEPHVQPPAQQFAFHGQHRVHGLKLNLSLDLSLPRQFGHGLAGSLVYFQRPHYPLPVVRVQLGCPLRVNLPEPVVQCQRRLSLQPPPQRRVRFRRIEEWFEQRLQVHTGAARDDELLTFPVQSSHHSQCVACEVGCRIDPVRLDHVNHVDAQFPSQFRPGLGRADVEPRVDLPRISRDDFQLELPSQLDRHLGLAHAGRTAEDQYPVVNRDNRRVSAGHDVLLSCVANDQSLIPNS